MNNNINNILLYGLLGGTIAFVSVPIILGKFHSVDSVRIKVIDKVNTVIVGKLQDNKHYICNLNTTGGVGFLECAGVRSPEGYVVKIEDLGDSETNITITNMIALYGKILSHTGCMTATIDGIQYTQDCEPSPSL